MENQHAYNLIVGAAMSLLGWLGKTLWDAVNELKKDVKDIEVNLPIQYVMKVDIQSRFDKIDTYLEKLFDKLEQKADK